MNRENRVESGRLVPRPRPRRAGGRHGAVARFQGPARWFRCALVVLPLAACTPGDESEAPRPADTASENTPGSAESPPAAERFCLDGEFDLGARYQGHSHRPGENYPVRFCITSAPLSGAPAGDSPVHFSGEGHSNADMSGRFDVTYLPPDRVRLVAGDGEPDILFAGQPIAAEARRVRRLDPRRLAAEVLHGEGWSDQGDGWFRRRIPGGPDDIRVRLEDDRVVRVETVADLPLRGRVPVVWTWNWEGAVPAAELAVEGEVMLRGEGSRRRLTAGEAEALWQRDGREPAAVELDGSLWPATTGMDIETISDGVHLVTGVRTGFHHLVVETGSGLVVADAPAGWVELHQVPPADLVPGLGISGLSERFIDFLAERFPGQPIRAVALTHAHDDHAGGARAFAAAGAAVYAPQPVATWLEAALNRETMPEDRLDRAGGRVTVEPVDGSLRLDDPDRAVELLELPDGPHVDAALGVWVPEAGVFYQSDLHVPAGETDAPRSDRLASECWFARWAVTHLPENARVYNSHTRVVTARERLASHAGHPSCQALQDSGSTATSSGDSPAAASGSGSSALAR